MLKLHGSFIAEECFLFLAAVFYHFLQENAKAFDLGSEDTMKQKYHAMKTQLWKYQQKEGEVRDKEEALLEKEGDWARLTQVGSTTKCVHRGHVPIDILLVNMKNWK